MPRHQEGKMKLIPYEHLNIKSALSKQEVITKLNNITEPKRNFWFFSSNTKPYQGKIENSHFEISRIIRYRNSFLPTIKGEVKSDTNTCIISLTMHPQIFVIVFMIFWLGVVGLAFLTALSTFIIYFEKTSIENTMFLLISGGMFVFGYGLLLGSFQFEAEKSKKFLQELFESEDIEEAGFSNLFSPKG